MKKKLPVSTFIKIYWGVIAIFAIISPLFRYLPKGQMFYLLLNAAAVGTVNYLAVESVVWTARKNRYIEFEELKTSLITNGSNAINSDMNQTLIDEVNKYMFMKKKQNVIDVLIVILAAALVIGA
ncbi:MAG: hypothetical protein HUJ80_05910 [Firmicutes bacterium]|nr:hypothetical protein [Bacillota bacterium]